MDGRTKDVVAAMIERYGSSDIFRSDCGLPINTYFSGVKMKWLMENVDSVKQAGEDLRFGTIDTWLIYVRNHLFENLEND